MRTHYFSAVEQTLRELAYMDDITDNHKQHLQYLLDSVSPERRIQYLQYLVREHPLRLEMIHMARYENEVGFGPMPDDPNYDCYRYYEEPPATIDSTIAKVRHLMQTYVPIRLEQERQALASIFETYRYEDRVQGEVILEAVNKLLGNEEAEVKPNQPLLQDVHQMSRAEVLECLGYSIKYLDKLVADGWLEKPIQRLPDAQWYFEKQDVLKFKRGEKYAEWQREQVAKQLDVGPSGVQDELAKPKRPAKRRPPKRS